LYDEAAAAKATHGGKRRIPLKKPEVLSPAGGWAQLKAAVENGADAVYFGLDHFNARCVFRIATKCCSANRFIIMDLCNESSETDSEQS
jgi:hypothetical protein